MSAGFARHPALPHPAARVWHDPVLAVAVALIAVLSVLFLVPRPVAIATPPALTLAVADLRGHALVVVRTDDRSATRRIALPGGPHEMVALPDGRLVVSLEQYGALAVVDVARGDVTRLTVGGVPHGLAVDGTTLYVTDRSADAVRRFSIDTLEERAPLPVGVTPHIVATGADGTLLVANAGEDTLNIGERKLPVSHVPESIAVGADGVVATAGSIGGTLHLFDRDGRAIGAHDLGGRPVRLQYDSPGRVLAASLSAERAVAFVEGGSVRRVVVGGVPDGLAFSPDGRWLYVGDMYGGEVAVVDVRQGRLVERLPAGTTAGALLVLPRP